MVSFYDFELPSIDGQLVRLDAYRGQVVLAVNVASQCAFTSQYAQLERLYREHHAEGFSVLGFPCGQFGNQEPGSEEEIKSFCSLKYDVSFPMFAKLQVNGPQTHPLYAYLKSERKGFLGTSSIKWNFTKFLIDRQGHVVKRFAPNSIGNIEKEVEKLLARQ